MTGTIWSVCPRISAVFGLAAVLLLSRGSLPAQTASLPQPISNLIGTWSGTFFPKHANVTPFSITIVVSTTPQGHLVATSTLNSECLSNAQMQVTVNGSSISFAGSDSEGDSLTVRASLDPSGLLQTTYILNGSASGRCETDDGSGSLAKH